MLKRSSVSDIKLSSFDDLLNASDARESVLDIPISELHPFANHPFKVIDDDAMRDTAESIAKYGVLVPAIARPRENGGYELIAGHRRKRAGELAGLLTMPVLVRNLDDDEATIIMVDSNLQRETLMFSEKAFAYKMKLDAMKRQGERTDLTSSQLGTKLNGKRSDELLSEQTGESRNQIQRYIRLTSLTPALLDMVDERCIAFNPAVELSYLSHEEQSWLLCAIESEQATPSLSQAQRMKKFSQDGKLSEDMILAILSEEKKETTKVTFTGSKLKKYFPSSYTPRQMEDTIIALLEGWANQQDTHGNTIDKDAH